MKKILYFLSFLITVNCSNTSSFKTVYWCGDHQCINKKERQDYFKKTMIVEIKDLKGRNNKNSQTEKLLEQAKLDQKKQIKDEKKLLKEEKLKRKREIIEEKELKKNEKRRAKEEKKLEKILKKDENVNKEKVKIIKQSNAAAEIKPKFNSFNNLVKNIKDKNNFKSYPDIDDIPK